MQSHQPVLTIDPGSIAANYKILNAYGVKTAAAVKANAYGTGADCAVPALYDAGCLDFFVATLDEGIALRALDLKNARIYILNGLDRSGVEIYKHHHLFPVLNSLADIEAAAGRDLTAALHFDTGMNRLGLGPDETARLLAHMDLLKSIDLRLIMSHFACADEKDHPLTQRQFEDFSAIAKYFPNIEKSLANSSGIFRSKAYHFDLLRPGVALYGVNPTPEATNPMQPVLTLNAPVLQIRNVKKGQAVGYAASAVLQTDSVTATLALGYADGFIRSLSHRGQVFWRGAACPILGRVSMDLTIIDLTHIPESQRPRPGDQIEIIGPHQSIDDLAAQAGTIGYEILTSLGHRYKRVYLK